MLVVVDLYATPCWYTLPPSHTIVGLISSPCRMLLPRTPAAHASASAHRRFTTMRARPKCRRPSCRAASGAVVLGCCSVLRDSFQSRWPLPATVLSSARKQKESHREPSRTAHGSRYIVEELGVRSRRAKLHRHVIISATSVPQ